MVKNLTKILTRANILYLVYLVHNFPAELLFGRFLNFIHLQELSYFLPRTSFTMDKLDGDFFYCYGMPSTLQSKASF